MSPIVQYCPDIRNRRTIPLCPTFLPSVGQQGLYGQTDQCWEAAGDLRNPVSDDDFARGMTWDVRLALGLMEATSDPQIGGKLWPIYGRLLPQPHTVTVNPTGDDPLSRPTRCVYVLIQKLDVPIDDHVSGLTRHVFKFSLDLP